MTKRELIEQVNKLEQTLKVLTTYFEQTINELKKTIMEMDK